MSSSARSTARISTARAVWSTGAPRRFAIVDESPGRTYFVPFAPAAFTAEGVLQAATVTSFGPCLDSDSTPSGSSSSTGVRETAYARCGRTRILVGVATVDMFQAARIIGCSPREAAGIFRRASAPLQAVESVALERYRWRAHIADPNSYWVTPKQATAVLGVSVQRVKQLLDAGRVPYVVHHSGVRLMRREQLETVANARQARLMRQGD